ncbi:unnamed protein product, partial [Amoebophrya sp. A120]
ATLTGERNTRKREPARSGQRAGALLRKASSGALPLRNMAVPLRGPRSQGARPLDLEHANHPILLFFRRGPPPRTRAAAFSWHKFPVPKRRTLRRLAIQEGRRSPGGPCGAVMCLISPDAHALGGRDLRQVGDCLAWCSQAAGLVAPHLPAGQSGRGLLLRCFLCKGRAPLGAPAVVCFGRALAPGPCCAGVASAATLRGSWRGPSLVLAIVQPYCRIKGALE